MYSTRSVKRDHCDSLISVKLQLSCDLCDYLAICDFAVICECDFNCDLYDKYETVDSALLRSRCDPANGFAISSALRFGITAISLY